MKVHPVAAFAPDDEQPVVVVCDNGSVWALTAIAGSMTWCGPHQIPGEFAFDSYFTSASSLNHLQGHGRATWAT